MDDAQINIAMRLIDQATSPMRNALQQIRSSVSDTERAAGLLSASLSSLGNMAIGGSLAAGVVVLTKNLIQADLQVKALMATFSAITGTQQQAGNEFAYIVQQANRFGYSIESVSDGYKKIAAAARGTVLQGQETRNIFEAVTQAGRVLYLSSEQVNGALLAISQIMSKGKVQAEELRGQLGERIPGAFQLAAKAMNMTTAELDKFMADGKLIAEDFLPKFAKVLNDEYAKGLTNAASQTDSSINKMKTAWSLLAADFAEGSGLAKAFRWTVDQITTIAVALDQIPSRLKRFGSAFANSLKTSIATGDTGAIGAVLLALGDATQAANKPLPTPSTAAQMSILPSPEIDRAIGMKNAATNAKKIFSSDAEDVAKAVEKARSPLEKYNAELAKANSWLTSGSISQDEFNKVVAKAGEDYQKAAQKGQGKAPVPYMAVDIDQYVRGIESKKSDLEKVFHDLSLDLESAIATGAGRGLDAQLIGIEKQFQDTSGNTWKKIAEAQNQYTELEQKLGGKRGGTAEAFAELAKAKKELDAAWSTGLSSIEVAEKIKQVMGEQASKQWSVEQSQTVAQLNVEYITLTGTMREQYEAQMQLIDASLKYNTLGKPTEVIEAYRKLADEQKRILGINRNGTFFEGMQDEARVIGNQIPTAAMQGREALRSFADGIKDTADALAEFSATGKIDIDSLTNTFIKDLLKMQYQTLMMKAMFGGSDSSAGGGLVGWITSLFGGGSGFSALTASAQSRLTTSAGLAHQGGIVGNIAQTTQVPAHIFHNAPRLHGGLKPDEYPAVLQTGEEVVSRSDRSGIHSMVRALTKMIADKRWNVTVTNNASGTKADVRQNQDGSLEVIIDQVEGAVASRIAKGRSQIGSAMESTYALNRGVGLRR